LVSTTKLRIVAVAGEDALRYRGFCRVIWNDHVKEMSDLAMEDRALLMNAVFCVESALRLSLNPDKINLACLGNMTPHLHWHVIPRFKSDPTFPKPIWAATNNASSPTKTASVATLDTVEDWKHAVRAAFQATSHK
jgi:diadenosine tetraphosphate (Ap4A) HIT family hydrolase